MRRRKSQMLRWKRRMLRWKCHFQRGKWHFQRWNWHMLRRNRECDAGKAKCYVGKAEAAWHVLIPTLELAHAAKESGMRRSKSQMLRWKQQCRVAYAASCIAGSVDDPI